MHDVYKYYAFISYKHEDEKYARWLQRRLEAYRLSAALQNSSIPERAKPIFRDNTDLVPGKFLNSAIEEKLAQSKYLIVICSKSLGQESEYVDREIRAFVEMGRADRIIPIIIDGEPHAENPEDECFCTALNELPDEILAANSKKDGRTVTVLKVLAAMFELDADELIRRDEHRRKKKRIIVSAISAVLSLLAVAAIIMICNLSFRNNLENAQTAFAEKDYTTAADYAAKALNVPGRRDGDDTAEAILRSCVISEELRNSNTQFHKEYEIEFPNEGIALYGESKDGSKVAFTDLGRAWVYDSHSGEYLAVYDMNSEKEALDEYLDPIRSTEKIVGSEYKEKTESDKYTQKIIGGNVLEFYSKSGNVLCSLDVGPRVMWAYSKDDSFVVISTNDEKNRAYVYSFDYNLLLELGSYDENLANKIWISDMGRYVFIEVYKKVNVYDTASGSLVAELVDDGTVSIGGSFFVSDSDRETAYFLSAYKAEKFVFEDANPEFDQYHITDDHVAVSVKNATSDQKYISGDGKKIMFDHRSISSYNVYNIFDIQSGEVLVSVYDAMIALDVDFKLCIAAVDNRVCIFDVDSQENLYTYETISPVISVAMNEDGSYAAYSTEVGVVFILERNGNGYRNKKCLTDFPTGEVLVSAMKGDRCIIYDENQSYMYSIDADSKENFSETNILEVNMYSACYGRRSVVKSEKFQEDMFLELNSYAGEYMFYDYESGERIDFGFRFLHPWDYFDESKLIVGAEMTGNVQVNSEFRLLRLEDGGYEEVYRYVPSFPVSRVSFDNTGKYIIFDDFENNTEVIEVATGKKLFTLDRKIVIYDDIIYDVSSDLVIPDKLPESRLYSISEFKDIAGELK